MIRRIVQGLIVAAVMAAGGLGVSGAQAYSSPAARIDEEIKPNFGILLHPPLYRHHQRRGVWRGRNYGWGDGPREGYGRAYGLPYGPSPYGLEGGPSSITVDCADRRFGPTPISDAAHWIADGGVVYVRARGVACQETIEIDHPVVIAAEDSPAFSTNPRPSPVVIAPPDGQPCVLVADGVREVELRGLELQAPRGGAASCIEAWSSEIALVRADIDYSGDGSAVYMTGGRLIVRETKIDAHTFDAAVTGDGTAVQVFKSRIRGDTIGMDLTLGPMESSIENSGVIGYRQSGPGSVGISVRGERTGGGLLRIRNVAVCGYRVAVGFQRGARGDITRSHLCRSIVGVMVEGADVGVTESAIGSLHNGVYVASGNARVTHNRIYDLTDPRDAVDGEPGAGIIDESNWYYLKYGCDRFTWDGRRFCKPNNQVPALLRDESAYDRDYDDGWSADGYDLGYTRDGPVGPFDKPKPPPRHHKKFRLFEFK